MTSQGQGHGRCPVPVIPLADWPERDRQAWAAALEPVSLFEDRPSLARYPAARIARLAQGYGRWLGYLDHAGLLSIGAGGDAGGSALGLLSQSGLRGYLERLKARLAPYSIRRYLTDLLIAVRHMVPDQDHGDLNRLVNHVSRTARPVGDKMSRLVPAYELYDLGFSLMGKAEAMQNEDNKIPLRALQLYRDGLALAMLIARPIRIGNFGRLELDRHLIRLDGCYRLVLEGDEVKTGRAYELNLPTSLTGAIDRYLETYRPHLLARSSRWTRSHNGQALWISRDGAPFQPKCLSERIVKITTLHFGHAVNPHLFRDCAATSIATDLPAHVGIIAPVLGHGNLRTAERHYRHAQSLVAGRRYQEVIDNLRAERS